MVGSAAKSPLRPKKARRRGGGGFPTPPPKITINTYNKEWIRGIHTSSKGHLIWVYDITKLSDNHQWLVKGAPFKTKTESASVLKTTRNTVTLYLVKRYLIINEYLVRPLFFLFPLGPHLDGDGQGQGLKKKY